MDTLAPPARSGGGHLNIRGFWPQTPEVIAKRLQLLQEAVPKVSRVALLWDPAFVGLEEQVRETRGPEVGALARRRFLDGHTDDATLEAWVRLAFPSTVGPRAIPT